MILYKLSRTRYADDLSGEGARRAGGRWNPVGVPVVYAAGSVALASIEALVHCDNYTLRNGRFVRVDIHVPDTASIEYLEVKDLPESWSDNPPPESLAELGRSWAVRCGSLLLRVPSAALSGHEYNYLVNPRHPDMKDVKIVSILPFVFDSRVAK